VGRLVGSAARDDEPATDEVVGGEADSPTALPHEKQNRAFAASGVPQLEQAAASDCPQPMQNRASAGFSVAQLEQRISTPASELLSKG
jgi:hypothetical protein